MASPSPARPAGLSPSLSAGRPARRRQRSVRVTVAVVLLSLATVAVLLALPTSSVAWLSAAAVFAVTCGWGSGRILYTELAETRRDHAMERAAQAQAYLTMFSSRADEHAVFTTAMTDSLVRRDRELQEMEGSLALSERRASAAEELAQHEAHKAQTAASRVAELEEALEVKQDEAVGAWDTSLFEDDVADLMAFEEQVAASHTGETPKSRKKGA